MVTIFNRRELLMTWSMEEQSRVRDILAVNGIDYQIKTVDHAIRDRGRSGSVGVDMSSAYQYYIYVRACDLGFSRACLRKLGMRNDKEIPHS